MNDDVVPCPKCNAEMFVGAHFCMRCGAHLSGGAMPRIELELELDEALSRAPETVRYPPPPPPPPRPDSSSRIASARPMRAIGDSSSRLAVVAKSDTATPLPTATLPMMPI